MSTKTLFRRSLVFVASISVAFVATLPASAQQGRGGPQLPPEEAVKAWAVQVNVLSKDLGLTEDESDKVKKVYQGSREELQKAIQEAIGEGGVGPDRFAEVREITDQQRKKLLGQLKGILGEDKGNKATGTLGTFNRQWDVFTAALTGLGLSEDTLQTAMGHVGKYVVAMEEARRTAIENSDFQSIRTARQELKAKLDESLAGVLTEEQLAKWKEATAFRGRRGPQ